MSLIAAAAPLLLAGVLSGKYEDAAPTEPKLEASPDGGNCADTLPPSPTPNEATADAKLVTESSPTPNSAVPSREPAKPGRKNRPAWPPPPELIA